MNIQLLVIDPQHDFCTANGAGGEKGSLVVGGADKDMERLAAMIRRIAPKLDDIHITLDSHRVWDIAHPIWWKDGNGNHPAPFTLISVADVESGKWTTTRPGAYKRSLAYLKALDAGKRYPHVIWPEHCIIGSWGHGVVPELLEATHEWERARQGIVDFVTKGSNPWTEHFSGVQAEVPDPNDPSTQVNAGLIATLETADIILLAGEARSHCLANTVRDIVKNFTDPKFVAKMHLLTDATSDVGGFEKYGQDFVTEMVALNGGDGMKVTTTVDFLR